MVSKAKVTNSEELSLAYTPGVAEPCLETHKDISKSYELTRRNNLVAVITGGTAVLGLGDFDKFVGKAVADAVTEAAIKTGVVRNNREQVLN